MSLCLNFRDLGALFLQVKGLTMTDELLIDQLRLIGKTAIGFVAILCCSFLFILWLTDFPLFSYRQASSHLFRTGIDLPWMMWLAGALILLITALSLWLSCLFITHRAVGPLYRFSRNLETALSHGAVPLLGIRSGDHFQEDSERLLNTARRLSAHEEQLASHCRQVIDQLTRLRSDADKSADNDAKKNRLQEHLAQLKATAALGVIDAN